MKPSLDCSFFVPNGSRLSHSRLSERSRCRLKWRKLDWSRQRRCTKWKSVENDMEDLQFPMSFSHPNTSLPQLNPFSPTNDTNTSRSPKHTPSYPAHSHVPSSALYSPMRPLLPDGSQILQPCVALQRNASNPCKPVL